MKKINVILKPMQQKQIQKLLKDAKFNRLCDALLNDRNISTDSKAKHILALKHKMYGR